MRLAPRPAASTLCGSRLPPPTHAPTAATVEHGYGTTLSGQLQPAHILVATNRLRTTQPSVGTLQESR